MRIILLSITLIGIIHTVAAQQYGDSLIEQGTLQNIIAYTLKHQPRLQKSALDEHITRSQVNSRLSEWYPQLDFNYNLQHNFQLQTAAFQGQVIQLGNRNTSFANLGYTQNLLNPNLVFAAQTAKDTRKLAAQTTESNRIDAIANVSKAFYDVLLVSQQIKVSTEDSVRLERSVRDARNKYNSGVADKTDYQRATIALNNTVALKHSNEEVLKARLAYLKSLMGYPPQGALELVYDSSSLENEVAAINAQMPDYNSRIEFQTLQTRKKLQEANLQFTKYSFIPSLSGYANYNINYLNDNISDLYRRGYPNSFAGISLYFPILNGGRRWMAIKQAKWQLKKSELDITDVQNNINSEYALAQAAYNSNYEFYLASKDNLQLAQQVYDVIQLQYRSGIKQYLELINAETDLRTSRINYYNSLFQVLSSKVDLQKALGQLK